MSIAMDSNHILNKNIFKLARCIERKNLRFQE